MTVAKVSFNSYQVTRCLGDGSLPQRELAEQPEEVATAHWGAQRVKQRVEIQKEQVTALSTLARLFDFSSQSHYRRQLSNNASSATSATANAAAAAADVTAAAHGRF